MTNEPVSSQSEPGEPATPGKHGMRRMPLPGAAAIALYLLLVAGTIVIGVVGRHYPPAYLLFSVAFMTASAGLIASFRWAWALALGAVFSLTAYNAWIFSMQRSAPSAVQGLLNLLFFLYLIRPEVREGMR